MEISSRKKRDEKGAQEIMYIVDVLGRIWRKLYETLSWVFFEMSL